MNGLVVVRWKAWTARLKEKFEGIQYSQFDLQPSFEFDRLFANDADTQTSTHKLLNLKMKDNQSDTIGSLLDVCNTVQSLSIYDTAK